MTFFLIISCDWMKKILITIIGALSIGGIFAIVIYKNIDRDVKMAIKTEDTITFFQVGVFKQEENALNFMKKYNSAIIIKDNDYFRVIIAILTNDEAIIKEKAFFDSLGIEYYLKKENVNNEEFIKKLKEYEQLLIYSSDETYNTINKKILKLYESGTK